MTEPTLNQKIEKAWANVRDLEVGLSVAERKTFRNRMVHIIANALDTDIDRVRQRIKKYEGGDRHRLT